LLHDDKRITTGKRSKTFYCYAKGSYRQRFGYTLKAWGRLAALDGKRNGRPYTLGGGAADFMLNRSRHEWELATTERHGTPGAGPGQLRSPSPHVQQSKGLPNLDRDAFRALPTQYVGPRHGFRVVDSLKVAGMNDVVGGIEEIDPVGVHSVAPHAAL
jgi:hypothetical protein